MSKLEKVAPTGSCHRLHVSAADFRKIKKIDHLRMLFLLQLIREFEDTLLELKDANLVHGPVHSSIGQEANAAAAAVVLKKSDLVGSTHRAHGHFLAKAVMYYAADDFDPQLNDLADDMQRAVNKTLAEIMGLKSGWCSGRGGSMHLSDPASGNIGSNGIVGGGIPLASGAAWAEKLSSGSRVVVSFFGDGAINQGCFHEVANMASLWDLPIVYFVENNLYAVATGTCTSSSCINLGLRSLSYGIDSLIVDGMDPVAVFWALQRVVSDIQAAPRPFLIESETYRFYHHAGRLPGSPFGYRSQTEETRWQEKDPLQVYAGQLVEKQIISGGQQADMLAKVKAAVSEAVAFCTAKTDGRRFIPDSHWPPPQDLVRDVRCEDDAFDGVSFVEKADFDQFSEMRYGEAVAAATLRNMQQDERVFVLGEEVANLHGGAYRATRGIKEVFPERLINTPISECGFVGMAGGAAITGLRPVVEIMYPDFALVACDQLFNQIGKLRHMYGGQVSFPLVARTRVAIGQGYGGQHSMNPAGLFSLFSGWRIVAPANAFDYIGLFNTAVRYNDPVLIIEHADLYEQNGPVPLDMLDYFVAYGKANVVRPGADLTVLSYLTGVNDAVAAAEELASEGLDVEVMDLRTLDYSGLDFDTIGQSVEKTGLVLILEQVPRSMGIASRISDEIQERFYDFLDAPVEKITAPDVPVPVSRALEAAMLPDLELIKQRLRAVGDA
ncbi:Acetoin dehydrogenase E1 component alpha-subunit (EC [Olavius sp. associated proteobacterium Delta 1]|nr:Acetoin dehydrogenase E1 component alpha-subunit (EC [Olavius sp. associated proteobacterium Delta 1]